MLVTRKPKTKPQGLCKFTSITYINTKEVKRLKHIYKLYYKFYNANHGCIRYFSILFLKQFKVSKFFILSGREFHFFGP